MPEKKTVIRHVNALVGVDVPFGPHRIRVSGVQFASQLG